MNPVSPPSSHPFSFPLPPEIKPPAKMAINEMAVTNHWMDDSCNDVNLNNIEKRKLQNISKIKMVNVPNSIALAKFFDSSMIPISFLFFQAESKFQTFLLCTCLFRKWLK